MTQWIETTGRTEEDAIAAALFQLGLERDDVSVQVVERAKSGFLGFGGNPAKVRVSYEAPDAAAEAAPEKKKEEPAQPKAKPAPQPEPKKAEPAEKQKPVAAKPAEQPIEKPAEGKPTVQKTESAASVSDDEKAAQIETFLVGLLQHMNVDAKPEISVGEDGNYKVILVGTGLGAIIGRRGETLDAVQQLTNYSVNRGQSKRVRIHIDAENYRAKREEALIRLANKVADKVIKYRKNVTLEAMNAYERHVIHAALQDRAGINTHSTGIDPNRRTVVVYAPEKK